MSDRKPRKNRKTYGLAKVLSGKAVAAPELAYQPSAVRGYKPGIGLIGCGGITTHHLTAYKNAGYRVLALCDVDEKRAQAQQAKFYPAATIYTDYRKLLAREDIEVVDIATHPAERATLIKAALHAGKHVLSQKPFVLDLSVGEKLVKLASRKRLKLAVNQNGRWAPHFSYMRSAIQAGLIGDVVSVHLAVHWNHNWVVGTPFDHVDHLVLYDFAIHWFDIVTCFMGSKQARRVYASRAHSAGQQARPPLLAQALIKYPGAQASLVFDADTKIGALDTTVVVGTHGTLTSTGTDLGHQTVQIHTEKGIATPVLQGSWFPDGFHGTMAELLCAIHKKREPSNSARDNLRSLALCFAAVKSSTQHVPLIPGTVRRISA